MANENGNIVYLFFFKALWFYGRRSVRSSDELTAPKPCDDDEPFRSLKQILVDQGKSNHPNIIQNSRM